MKIRQDIIKRKDKSDEFPESLIEYGFHYSHAMDTVRNCAHVLKYFGKWPEEGGYFDQDANLIDDMLTYQALESHIEKQYKEDSGGG